MARSIGRAILAKSVVLTAAILTYSFYPDLRKVEYNLFEKKQYIEEGFFPNPAILKVDWKANDDGKIESYIINSESEKEVSLMYDMHPKTWSMLNSIESRIAQGQVSDSLVDRLYSLYKSSDKKLNPDDSFFSKVSKYIGVEK